MGRSFKEQVIHFLSDMYSIEQQALVQMVSAPKMAGDPKLAEDFRTHYDETQEHAELVQERLEAHGQAPSPIKDTIMRLGGKGFVLFAQLQSETPGRLADHAFSYEAMEWAGYEMLLRFAERADDYASVDIAKRIAAQEYAMMQKIKSHFSGVEEICHGELSPEKLAHHLRKHLADVHAFESQTLHLINKSEPIHGSEILKEIYRSHLDQTRSHAHIIEANMKELDSHSSIFKDNVLGVGGLSWGFFFQTQSDTPAKLAAFIYAVLHLEIGGYELLRRTAHRCGDLGVEQACEKILSDKKNMAEQLARHFDEAVHATLDLLHR